MNGLLLTILGKENSLNVYKYLQGDLCEKLQYPDILFSEYLNPNSLYLILFCLVVFCES